MYLFLAYDAVCIEICILNIYAYISYTYQDLQTALYMFMVLLRCSIIQCFGTAREIQQLVDSLFKGWATQWMGLSSYTFSPGCFESNPQVLKI